MSPVYTIQEDVTLIQAVLHCRAHVTFAADHEIDPMTKAISNTIMPQVASKYCRIAHSRRFTFRRRSPRALCRRFQKMLRCYALATLPKPAEAAQHDNFHLRNRLLKRVLDDREQYNVTQRHRASRQFNIQQREKQMVHCYDEPPKKRMRVALTPAHLPNNQNQPAQPTDRRCQHASPSQHHDKPLRAHNLLHAKQNAEQQSVVAPHQQAAASPTHPLCCVQFIMKMIQREFELKSQRQQHQWQREQHEWQFHNELLRCAQTENKHPSWSEHTMRLRLQYLNTMLATQQLQVRLNDVEQRQSETMWCLLRNLLAGHGAPK